MQKRLVKIQRAQVVSFKRAPTVNTSGWTGKDIKQSKKPAVAGFFAFPWTALDAQLVEAGGIEPPSASPLQAVLHT